MYVNHLEVGEREFMLELQVWLQVLASIFLTTLQRWRVVAFAPRA
jgi:hypothetical protein